MSQKSFWVKKVFGSKKFLGQKSFVRQKSFVGQTKILSQKSVLGKKSFSGKKSFLGKKKFFGQNSFFGLPPTPLPPSPTNFRKYYPDLKLKNNWGPLSLTFHVEQPGTLIEWKFKSISDQRTDRLTWVGARDTCVSKKTSQNHTLPVLSPGFGQM